MNRNEPLQFDRYYHIYNRGINSCEIFRSEKDYLYFIKLYNKYIHGFAKTYAWALMPTHFHFIIKIEQKNEFGVLCPVNEENLHQNFSNMYNAYAKAYNLWCKRHGSLFERGFKKIYVDTEDYFRNLLLYIHNNPVHINLSNKPDDYLWSSYHTFLGKNNLIQIESDFVIDSFGDFDNFVFMHREGRG